MNSSNFFEVYSLPFSVRKFNVFPVDFSTIVFRIRNRSKTWSLHGLQGVDPRVATLVVCKCEKVYGSSYRLRIHLSTYVRKNQLEWFLCLTHAAFETTMMVLSSNTFLTKAVRSARFFFAGFLRLFLSRCSNRLSHIFSFPSLAKINLIVDYVCRTPGIVQIAYTGGRSNNFVVLVQDFTPEWLNLVDFPPSDAFDTLKRLWESFGTYSISCSLHFSVLPSSKSILIITGPSAVASRMCPSPSVISCGLGKGCSLLTLGARMR